MSNNIKPITFQRDPVRVASLPPPVTVQQEVGISDLLGFARRRIWHIAGTAILLTAVAALILLNVTPRYTASALIMVDDRAARVVNPDPLVAGLPRDAESVASEIEVIRSRRLANKTVEKLQLDADPEFKQFLEPDGATETSTPENAGEDAEPAAGSMRPRPSLRGLSERWFGDDDSGRAVQGETVGRDAGETTYAGEDLIGGQRVELIDAFQKRLRVQQRGQSRVISISFSAANPRTAALVANTLADQYLLDQLDSKYEAIRQATHWLNARVQELREKVEVSEKAVEQLRRESGLIEGKGVTLSDQQLAELNSQLIMAQSSLTEARARQRQIRQLLASPDGVESAGEVLGSALIQRLREQQARVQGEVAELSAEFGDLHPRMIKLRAEAADLNAKIEAEIDKIVKALDYEVGIARARVSSLQNSLANVEKRVAEANTANVTLRALEREAEANRILLNTMMTQFLQASSQNDITSQQPDARIISRADIPNSPSFPATKAILGLVFVGGTFIGLILAFAAELLDKAVRGSQEVRQLTGVPSLGIVPYVKELAKGRQTATAYLRENPETAFSESIRTLQASIGIAAGRLMPQTILVTSSREDEGKTTVASSLATMLAMQDVRVAIIDTDSRRPAVHRAFGVPAKPGLKELLTGEVMLHSIIEENQAEGMPTIIPAGAAMSNTPSLLAENMRVLLAHLENEFDHVIIDSPPIMAISDTLVLAGLAKATVFVARWGKTSRESVRLGLERTVEAGGRPVGVVLSMVDIKRYARYGYGDSGSYAGYYAA